MNKDIRINWNVGMELMPETFIHLENQWAEYRLLLRKVQALRQFGLIPDTGFNVDVSLDGDTLTLTQVECHALLPKGTMVHLDRSLERTFPLEGSVSRYLAVWPTDEERAFERDEVPFLENECQFGLRSLDELPGSMPLAKAVFEDGAWKLQDDYILPVMSLENSSVMMEMLTAIRKLTMQITHHEKAKLLRNYDLMKLIAEEIGDLDGTRDPRELVPLCRRFIRLFSYLTDELPAPTLDYNPYDIQLFLHGVCSYLIKAYEIIPTLQVVEYQPIQKQAPVDDSEPESEEDFPIL